MIQVALCRHGSCLTGGSRGKPDAAVSSGRRAGPESAVHPPFRRTGCCRGYALSQGTRHDGRAHDATVAVCLALLLGLFALVVAVSVPAARESQEMAVGLQAGEGTGSALRAGRGHEVTRLRYELPEDAPGPWMLRVDRGAFDAVWIQIGDWRSPSRGFFQPGADEGVLPSAFLFELPATRGAVELDLHTVGSRRLPLHPRVMTGAAAQQMERYGVAASAMIYASLFTIALLALALFSAARDRLFLALFAFAMVALLTLAAVNGHLYQLPGLGGFGIWGTQGVHALALLTCATWLQLLLLYTGAATGHRWKRVVDVATLVLVAVCALRLLNLGVLVPLLQPVQALLYCLAALLGLGLLVDAGRRRLPMAWALAFLVSLTLVGVVASTWASQEPLPGVLPLRYGYQLGTVLGVAILAVGLIGRISEYRHQRDRELLARTDTERRMQREAARSDLVSELQLRLRALPLSDIEWTAYRLLLERLLPLLPVERSAVVTQGHHGSDVLVVEPASAMGALRQQLEVRRLALKRQAANALALQQPVTMPGQASVVAMEAVVPLPIRAPGWGALLLQRAGSDGFTTEELSLASEFARLAVQHIDQAVAAVNLRRSAELDALTGSLNRRTIDQWLARSFGEAARQQQPVSVLFIDLDHFKSVNDRHGHACGDFCLRSVALALRGALDEGDLFGRYGGEEFIAVLPGRGGAAARMVAEQLRMAVEALRPEWNGKPLMLTVSVGVATRLEHEETPEAALQRADRALYSAKAAGRNCVQVAPAVFR